VTRRRFVCAAKVTHVPTAAPTGAPTHPTREPTAAPTLSKDSQYALDAALCAGFGRNRNVCERGRTSKGVCRYVSRQCIPILDAPTSAPTTQPTANPTTPIPSTSPTAPTDRPTSEPSVSPTVEPTQAPTTYAELVDFAETECPKNKNKRACEEVVDSEDENLCNWRKVSRRRFVCEAKVTHVPTAFPTESPTTPAPTNSPTVPTNRPTAEPSVSPTLEPTQAPTTYSELVDFAETACPENKNKRNCESLRDNEGDRLCVWKKVGRRRRCLAQITHSPTSFPTLGT